MYMAKLASMLGTISSLNNELSFVFSGFNDTLGFLIYEMLNIIKNI